jgi:GNAT superfamily N-acetyltransferase
MPVYTVLIDQEKEAAFSPLLDPCFRDSAAESDVVALGVASDDDIAAGALLAWIRSEWLDIGWIYVAPEFRGQGMGELLVSALEMSAKKTKGIYGAFAEYTDRQGEDGLERMFQVAGFKIENERKPFYIFKLKELENNQFWQKSSDNPNVLPLERVDRHMLNAFTLQLMKTEQQIAIELPIDWLTYHPGLSVAYVRDGMITGILLFRESEGMLTLEYAHVLPGYRDAMGFMMKKAGQVALQTYPGETPVNIVTVNEVSEAIVEKLFPSIGKMPIRRAVMLF